MSLEVLISAQKLDFPAGLEAWIASVRTKIQTRILSQLGADTSGVDRYMECIELEQLPGAFLCCAFYQRDMNDAFTRMGMYMGAGKGIETGTLLPHYDPTLINYKKLVAGHNLPGPVVRNFLISAEGAGPGLELNDAEGAFTKAFLNRPEAESPFYLIGFAIQNMKPFQNVVSHEIFHAQRFLNGAYHRVIQDFWHFEVSAADRGTIHEILGLVYNTSSEALIIDEFQAFLLQADAERDRLHAFVDRYRDKLRGQLADQGVNVLSLEST